MIYARGKLYHDYLRVVDRNTGEDYTRFLDITVADDWHGVIYHRLDGHEYRSDDNGEVRHSDFYIVIRSDAPEVVKRTLMNEGFEVEP